MGRCDVVSHPEQPRVLLEVARPPRAGVVRERRRLRDGLEPGIGVEDVDGLERGPVQAVSGLAVGDGGQVGAEVLGAELHHLGRGVAGNAADEVGEANDPGGGAFGAPAHTEPLGRGAVLAEDVPDRGVGLAQPAERVEAFGFEPAGVAHQLGCEVEPHDLADHHQPVAERPGVAHDALERGRRLVDQRGLDVHRRDRGQTGKGELVHRRVDPGRGRLHRLGQGDAHHVHHELAGREDVRRGVTGEVGAEHHERRRAADAVEERVRREVARSVGGDGRHPRDGARDDDRRQQPVRAVTG